MVFAKKKQELKYQSKQKKNRAEVKRIRDKKKNDICEFLTCAEFKIQNF